MTLRKTPKARRVTECLTTTCFLTALLRFPLRQILQSMADFAGIRWLKAALQAPNPAVLAWRKDFLDSSESLGCTGNQNCSDESPLERTRSWPEVMKVSCVFGVRHATTRCLDSLRPGLRGLACTYVCTRGRGENAGMGLP